MSSNVEQRHSRDVKCELRSYDSINLEQVVQFSACNIISGIVFFAILHQSFPSGAIFVLLSISALTIETSHLVAVVS